MTSHRLVSVGAALLLLLLLVALVGLSSAAAAVAPPVVKYHQPSGQFHGWNIYDLCADPVLNLTYIIDSQASIVAIDQNGGNWSLLAYTDPYQLELYSLTVDSRSIVYASAWSQTRGAHVVAVSASGAGELRWVSLSSLSPPAFGTLQLVTDSGNNLYLLAVTQNSSMHMWVLDPDTSAQIDHWTPPVPAPSRRNFTDYILAIDPADNLYLHQDSWDRKTFLVSTAGAYISQFDLFSGYWYWSDFWATDLAVDANGVMNFVGAGSDSILRFTSSGVLLGELQVLSQVDQWDGPLVTIDSRSRLQVADLFYNEILVVRSNGDVHRVFASDAATLSGVSSMLIDPNSGDILVSDYNGPTIAQRISPRDGSLLQVYQLPGRLTWDAQCRSTAIAYGAKSNRVYALLSCYDQATYQSSNLVHVQARNGHVMAEFRLQDAGYGWRLRVDEYNNRILVPSYDNYGQGVVLVYDLKGRLTGNLTASPPLGFWIDNIVPDPDGLAVLILDTLNQRIVSVFWNGTTRWSMDTSPLGFVTDIVFRADGSFFYSLTQRYYINNTYSYNSSVQVYNGNPATDVYMGYGQPPLSGGPAFGALLLSRGELYAFDYTALTLYFWKLSADGGMADAQPVLLAKPQTEDEGW